MAQLSLKEAMYWQQTEGNRVHCLLCPHGCRIAPSEVGLCRVRQNMDGVLRTLTYDRVSAVPSDPIEQQPLFHFYPGSQVFSMGTLGCNFHCKHCQNWEISMADGQAISPTCQHMQPRAAIEAAKHYRCQGIAWTYNEPAVWFDYTLDCAKLA